MKGLTDEELWVLETYNVGIAQAGPGGRDMSPSELEVVQKLIERGLLTPWIHYEGGRTTVTNQAGVDAIKYAKAARRLLGESDR